MSKALAVAMVVLATTASAAEPPTGTPTTVSGVDVTARSRRPAPPMRAVRAFVGSLSVMSIGDQLAIWSKTAIAASAGQLFLGPLPPGATGARICPVVSGLPPDYARFIVARLRQVGVETGAPVSQTDCTISDVNLDIVVPGDAAAFIRELADDAPAAFGFDYHGMLVRDLRKPVMPIRAWYATDVIYVTARASRLSTRRVSVIDHVLVIVDVKQTDALNMGQLSDYITMSALAELKPDAVPPDAPSILNVFSDIAAGRTPADGLTHLDLAYLKALYAIDPRQVGALQKDQIADRIRQDLAGRQ